MRSKALAVSKYEENRAKAIDLLDRMLKNLQADRQQNDLTGVNWGHVGTMGDYADRLQHLSDSMFREGEHSPEANRR